VVSDTLPVLSNRIRLIRIGTATPIPQQEESVTFNPAQIREFTPQNYDLSTVSFGIQPMWSFFLLMSIQSTLNGNTLDTQVSYDPFTMPNSTQSVPPAQYNPYLEDSANMVGGTGAAYYPPQSSYAAAAQPVSDV